MDANQLTTKSQEAVAAAQRRALRDGNPAVEPEHLLWAVLQDDTGLALSVLESVGVDLGERPVRHQPFGALAIPEAHEAGNVLDRGVPDGGRFLGTLEHAHARFIDVVAVCRIDVRRIVTRFGDAQARLVGF